MKKALIAMSGGVDSAVAAYVMKNNGYECIGATMNLFDNEVAGVSKEKSCCSLDDTQDAKSVARRIGIDHFVFNFKEDFKREVIDRFIASYESGATPNPCIDCNRYLKFEKLYKRAQEMECDCVATGHYAVIEKSGEGYFLKKAADPEKDQSYVLYSIPREQLAHTVFPLGNLKKSEVRAIAEENGFTNAKKRDSQDICFVPDGDYASVIKLHTGKEYPCGNFVDRQGNVLGEHKGIIKYTVGQRKGLGLALPEPLYVCEKCLDTNEVILGKNEELFSCHLDIEDTNWLAFDNPPEHFRASVKIRYRQSEQPATVTVTGEKTAHIEFDMPQRAITRGQAAVIYDGDTVIGGGTIC